MCLGDRTSTQWPGAFRKHAPGLTGRRQGGTSPGCHELTPYVAGVACGSNAQAICDQLNDFTNHP
jgi:hypothetical protein